jgi:hypothetical protein
MEGRSQVMLMTLADQCSLPFTGGRRDTNPRFSPDGGYLAFLRPDDKQRRSSSSASLAARISSCASDTPACGKSTSNAFCSGLTAICGDRAVSWLLARFGEAGSMGTSTREMEKLSPSDSAGFPTLRRTGKRGETFNLPGITKCGQEPGLTCKIPRVRPSSRPQDRAATPLRGARRSLTSECP